MVIAKIKPVVERKIALYLMKHETSEIKIDELINLMKYFKYKIINFASIDLNGMDLETFHETPLAEFLNNLKIPYIPIDIPKYAKECFYDEVHIRQNRLRDTSREYDFLEQKNSFQAEQLKFLIDLNKDEIKARERFLNKKLKPQLIVREVLNIMEKCKLNEITFIHFGVKETFPKIMKLLRGEIKFLDVCYLHAP